MPVLDCNLTTPTADNPALSFCAPETGPLAEWVAQLPMANTIESSGLLHRAVTEVGRLSTDPSTRMALLEVVRPPLHYICARLDRTSSHAAGAGEGHAQLAQALQTELSSGYKRIVADLLDVDVSVVDKDLVGQAIHRSLSDISRTLVRAAQFYSTVPKRTWYEINHLFHLAERLDITAQSFADEENLSGALLSIADTYLRIALFATTQPNQLRPPQISMVFNALEHWTPEVGMGPVRDDTMFAVDLEADAPPAYRDLGLHDGEHVRGLRTDVLVYSLEAYLAEIASDIPVPDYVEAELLRHLVHAWGVLKKRSFRRSPASGLLKVCVGLRSVHYFASGGVEFAEQIGTTEALLKREINPFLDDGTPTASRRPADVWNDAFDVRGGRIPENPNIADPTRILVAGLKKSPQEPLEVRYPCYDAEIVDTSPVGYCVQWKSPTQTQLISGELIAVREAQDPRWVLAAIRWIRHQDTIQIGVELLSPRAIPVAIRPLQKRAGHSEPQRALLLPAIESIAQPAMLITPRLPFRESQKIHIQRQGIHATAQLMRRVHMTESFTQFTFRMLDGYLDSTEIALNMESLWDMIGADESELSKGRK